MCDARRGKLAIGMIMTQGNANQSKIKNRETYGMWGLGASRGKTILEVGFFCLSVQKTLETKIITGASGSVLQA